MATKTKPAKRGAKPVTRERILVQLSNEGPQPVKALGTTQTQIQNMINLKLVRETKDVIKTGKKGRPAKVYALTIGGRSAVKGVLKRAAQDEVVA